MSDDALRDQRERAHHRTEMVRIVAESLRRDVGSGIDGEEVARRALNRLRDAGYGYHVVETGRDLDEPVVEVGARHPATAKAMADRALPRSGSYRRSLVELLSREPDGLTDYEIADRYGKSHQAASGGRATLKTDGWVKPLVRDGIAVTRINEYGNAAIAWTLTPAARARLSAAS